MSAWQTRVRGETPTACESRALLRAASGCFVGNIAAKTINNATMILDCSRSGFEEFLNIHLCYLNLTQSLCLFCSLSVELSATWELVFISLHHLNEKMISTFISPLQV